MKTYFEEIEDRRQQWKIKYNLVETIIITIVAVVAGAEHWNEIFMYCKAKEQLLREKLGLELKNGIPSEDTFQRIFAIINPKELEKCFVNWVRSIRPDIDREIISVDGKNDLRQPDRECQCDPYGERMGK